MFPNINLGSTLNSWEGILTLVLAIIAAVAVYSYTNRNWIWAIAAFIVAFFLIPLMLAQFGLWGSTPAEAASCDSCKTGSSAKING